MNGAPNRLPNHDIIPLRKAMNARKAIKLAMMLNTRNTAFEAPCAAASRAFDSVLRNCCYQTFSWGNLSSQAYPSGKRMSFAFVWDLSASGSKSLAIARAAGADITEADIKCDALIPKLMYAANTEPDNDL